MRAYCGAKSSNAEVEEMVTRKSLAVLAGVTLVLFGIAGLIGQHPDEKALDVIGTIAWNGFLLGLLLLIVGSVLVIVRSTRGRTRRAT
jgi:cytochrome c oxidase assembly factor CtaG